MAGTAEDGSMGAIEIGSLVFVAVVFTFFAVLVIAQVARARRQKEPRREPDWLDFVDSVLAFFFGGRPEVHSEVEHHHHHHHDGGSSGDWGGDKGSGGDWGGGGSSGDY
jgi:uncharacterized membrane protein YgcG